MSSETKTAILREMGIEVWKLRANAAQESVTDKDPLASVMDASLPPASGSQADSMAVAGMDWDPLAGLVKNCTRCTLCETRTQTVFGVGNRKAEWMVIGEAPGADEDAQGEPFVGRAGRLLNSMLLAIGLPRESVYIANILKCRPPNNRDPKPEEASACRDYLERQIRLVQPKILLAVGRIAAQNLMQVDTPIGKMRGQVYRYQDTGIPVVITYHPAYLLRSPLEKRKAWVDLQFAKRIYHEACA